jgi:Fur family transcriptional regulator, ferric uptake regulator
MTDKSANDKRIEGWLDCLKSSGYRLTSPRRAVIDALASTQQALNATEIYDLARKQYPSLGLVSVYRTLEKLEELELIQRVHHPDGCQAFIAGFTGHQHLLICQSCGRTQFFEGDDLEPLFERVALQSGYQISEHWLQLFGFCVDCQHSKP